MVKDLQVNGEIGDRNQHISTGINGLLCAEQNLATPELCPYARSWARYQSGGTYRALFEGSLPITNYDNLNGTILL